MSDDYVRIVNSLIYKIKKQGETISILEAGCGSRTSFDYGNDASVTGVDISREQLDKNEYVTTKIQGNIQNIILDPASYDVIICWEVLEHLATPTAALNNFAKWLKDNGIIAIGVPNVLSLKGILTKFTPYKLHCWYSRNIMKWVSTPFPTYSRISISPISLRRYARKHDLQILWSSFRQEWLCNLRARSKFFYVLYMYIGLVLKLLSFGVISMENTEFVIIYRKAPK